MLDEWLFFMLSYLDQEIAGRVMKVMENNLHASKDKIMVRKNFYN